MRRKAIAVDLTPYVYGRAAGYNEYIFSLLEGLAEVATEYPGLDVSLIIRRDQIRHFAVFEGKFKVRAIGPSGVVKRVLWQNFVLPFLSLRFDLLLFTGNFAPVLSFRPYVLVVHDLNFLKFPQNFSFLALMYRRLVIKGSVRKSARTIAISSFVRNEIFGLARVEAAVIYNPVRTRLATVVDAPREPLILCASALDTHKNIVAAYGACISLVRRHPELRIVFIGNWVREDFPCAEFHERISLEGYVSYERKQELLASASCILAPSIYEGFGMPYVEAAINKKALICCAIPIANEVVGSYPYYIKTPFDEGAITEAIEKAFLSGFALRASAGDFSEKYSPVVIARKYLELIERHV